MRPATPDSASPSLREALANLGDALAEKLTRRAAGRLVRSGRIGTANPKRLEIEQEAVEELDEASRLRAQAADLRGGRP